MRTSTLSVVPAKAGTHNPGAHVSARLSNKVIHAFRNHRRHGVWVPAFAGTTHVCVGTTSKITPPQAVNPCKNP
jgi:hypothetical protein